MILFPAIDIKDGKVVRLIQGQFDKVTEYSHDPVSIANKWIADGAEWLHVVDLDGAKTGTIHNFDAIAQIAADVSVPVQMGGGVRSEDDIKRLLNAGVKRIILGTRAIEDRKFFKNVLSQWGDQVALSLDCSNGMVASRGWAETTGIKGTDLAKELEALGLKTLIYTDIARDGMLTGPNFDGLNEMLDTVNIDVIASGGVSNLDDIKRLSALVPKGLIGAITGRAIYEGTLNLKEAIAAC